MCGWQTLLEAIGFTWQPLAGVVGAATNHDHNDQAIYFPSSESLNELMHASGCLQAAIGACARAHTHTHT